MKDLGGPVLIVLVVLMVTAVGFAYCFSQASAAITGAGNTLSSLNSQILALQAQVTADNPQITALKGQVAAGSTMSE